MQIDGIIGMPYCTDGIRIVHRHSAGSRLIVSCIFGAVGGGHGNGGSTRFLRSYIAKVVIPFAFIVCLRRRINNRIVAVRPHHRLV